MTGSTASENRPLKRGPTWPAPDVAHFAASRAAAPEVRAAYEHPWIIRATHWVTAVTLFVLVGSGLQISHRPWRPVPRRPGPGDVPVATIRSKGPP